MVCLLQFLITAQLYGMFLKEHAQLKKMININFKAKTPARRETSNPSWKHLIWPNRYCNAEGHNSGVYCPQQLITQSEIKIKEGRIKIISRRD